LINKPSPPAEADRTRGPAAAQGESRATEALTVAWMLACMSAATSLLVAGAMRLLMTWFPVAGRVHPLMAIARALFFVALASGALVLIFTPLVVRSRRRRAPRAIVITAVLIGLAPMVAVAAMMIWS
jgi:hypothetical protein